MIERRSCLDCVAHGKCQVTGTKQFQIRCLGNSFPVRSTALNHHLRPAGVDWMMTCSWDDYLSRSLYESAARGQVRTFNQLLAEGVNPNWCRPDDGSTPLHIAAQKGRSSFVLGLLRAGADTCARDARGRTALDVCRERTTLFSNTASSNDCALCLTQARNSQAAARSQFAAYEGIAVIHPGEEIDLASVPGLACA